MGVHRSTALISRGIAGAVVGLLLVSSIPAAIAATNSELTPLVGNVPPGIDNAHLLGHADASKTVGLTIGLALRDAAGLASTINALQDPTSASYHQWLTTQEFNARFGPTPESIAAVTSWLNANGFKVEQANSRMLKATGTIAQAEKAFGVTISSYDLNGRTVIANAQEPQVPAALAPYIVRVGGLDTVSLVVPATKITVPSAADINSLGVAAPLAGTPLDSLGGYQHHSAWAGGQYYLDRDLQVAYNEKGAMFDQGLRGTPGNEIAIVSSYNVQLSDLNDALAAQGYPQFTGAYSGAHTTSWTCLYWQYWWGNDDAGCYFQAPTSTTNGYDSVESTLDAQMIGGVANDMHIGLYLAGDQSVDTFSQVYQYVADRANTIKVVGHSWGLCVPNMPTSTIANDEAAFAEAVAGGQAWFVASGDSGSADCSGSSAAAVDYPAASPLVTAVGGTSLQNNWGADGWNAGWTNEVACASSGGGVAPVVSNYFNRPSWQVGTGVPAGNTRVLPDVSLHFGQSTCGVAAGFSANHRVKVGGNYYEAWGTSPDSQLMAAFWAVENQQLAGLNAGPAAPLLFRILNGVSGTTPATTYHDITSGCNGAYCAGSGFDMVTGVGTPKFTNLLGDLQKLLGSITALAAVSVPSATRLDTLQFTDLSTNVACSAASWSWNFGDGTSSTLQNPTHRYASLGVYTVRMTVTGVCGKSSTFTLPVISITNLVPTACLSAPSTISAGAVLNLLASCSSDVDGTIAQFQWTLDGVAQSATGSTLSPVFTAVGSHTVSVKVVDNDGAVSNPATATIGVNPGALTTILVTPVSLNLRVALTNVFHAAGLDAYGNSVNIVPTWTSTCGSIATDGTFTAPTAVGSCVVRATANGVTGSANVAITPGSLASIRITPASFTLRAAGTQILSAVGLDSYGNTVAITPTWSSNCGSIASDGTFTAPTNLVTCTITATAGGFSASSSGSIVPAGLAAITVSGPATVVAGSTAHYTLAGVDAYGNAVTLAQSGLDWTAPNMAGPAVVSYTEQGVTGSKAVVVLPGPLATISVSGPSSLPVGVTATFTLAGFDGFGNAVNLAKSSLDITAPTTVGTIAVSYTEQGVTGTKSVTIVAGSLASITIGGPSSLGVGLTTSFPLVGKDAYGNLVQLAQSALSFTAPTTVGTQTLSYTENGVTGSKTISIVAGPLASIVVSGPASLLAGATASYSLAGFDAYGNAVQLAQNAISFTAPTLAGPTTVSYAEQGITGSKAVQVLPGPLATIRVSGPNSVRVGTTTSFTLAGFDAYNNAVTLAQNTLGWTAPTQAGSAVASYSEQGITGTKTVSVVAGTLARISVAGPSTVTVATTTLYNLAGFDQYNNPVTLQQSTLSYLAPTSVGTAQVCYTESGVQGCAPVTIVAGALAHIGVTGPSTLAAGTSATYTLAGTDAYGNAVALLHNTLGFTAPTSVGPASVTYTESGITGSKTVQVIAGPLATISVSGPASLLAGATASYNLAGADQYGNAVALAQSVLSFTAPTTVGTAIVSYTEQGITGTKNVNVLPGALATIRVSGPQNAIAGSTLSLSLAGFDQYANAVQLAQTTMTWNAPTLVGNAQACNTQQGITGCTSILVLPGPLATIALTGPASTIVGSTVSYALSGADQYGNAVQLAQSTMSWNAPTTPGHVTVLYQEQGVTGSKGVDVLHGALATIRVTGPSSLVAGSSAIFQVAGLDSYQNAVPLARTTIDFSAPTMVGTSAACYAESGVTGCASVTIVPAALDHVVIDPASTALAVTTSKDFVSGGFDRFNNVIDITPSYTAQRGAFSGATYTAPSQSGTTLVTAVTNGVSGSAQVQVTPGALERIVITGASSVKAGGAATYSAAGFDHWGNPVAVTPIWSASVGSINGGAFSAPTQAGNAVLTVTQGAITGSLTIAVLPEALHHITVSAPAGTLNVGRDAAFSAAGYDRYGNVVNAPIAWSATAGAITNTGLLTPDAPGEVTVTAASGAIHGDASVVVLGRLLTSAGMSQTSYLPSDALVSGVTGSVHATFLDATAVPNGNVVVTILQTSPLGTLRQTSLSGVTDSLGNFAFAVPTAFELPGDYIVNVHIAKLGNTGDATTTYHIGAPDAHVSTHA